MDPVDSPIAMTIVSGFLGAGKTTLVNHLLREGFGNRRLAIVVNDFGRVAIDSSLIESAEGNIVTLRNGCVCCSLAGDLVAGLATLLERRETFDAMLMETSGITSLGTLLALMRQSEMAARIHVARAVTLVDPRRHETIRKRIVVVDDQVAHADLIVMNWSDAVEVAQRDATLAAIREVNASAPVIETDHARVDPETLLAPVRPRADSGSASLTGHDHWTGVQLTLSKPIDADAFVETLRALPPTVERIKGFIHGPEGWRHIERSGDAFANDPWTGETTEEIRRGTVTLIMSEPLDPTSQRRLESIPGIIVEPMTAEAARPTHDPHA